LNLADDRPAGARITVRAADVGGAARDDDRVFGDRERRGSALTEHADEIWLIGLVGAAKRKQGLVHHRRHLTHAVVADGDGELLGLLLIVENDREALADLVYQYALFLPFVIVEPLDRIELREAEVAQHRVARVGRHDRCGILQ
jgi:hypothetical protein